MLDQELLAKAEANDVQAIFEVAKAYYIGDGVEENNDKAFELFSKVVALDPNFPDVYSRIGRCYEKGWGSLLIGLRGIFPQRPHAAEGVAADEVIGFELDHGRCDHIQEGFDACSLPALRRCFFRFLCQMSPSFTHRQ